MNEHWKACHFTKFRILQALRSEHSKIEEFTGPSVGGPKRTLADIILCVANSPHLLADASYILSIVYNNEQYQRIVIMKLL
jgi:hypothetical protein